jgi:ribosome-associated translation inhibitor RaiA
MDPLDFQCEFRSKVPDLEDALRAEAKDRLLALARGHTDMIGASVTPDELTRETTPHRFEARIVVYMRPTNQAAAEKADSSPGALKGALNAIERPIREARNKLRQASEGGV